MITRPDAYLSQQIPPHAKLLMGETSLVANLELIGDILMSWSVKFVDSSGDVTGEGFITGRISSIVEFAGQPPIAVFSTGERVALELL